MSLTREVHRAGCALIIIGDTRLYCDGIARLLEVDRRAAVLGVAYNPDEGLNLLAAARPDVAVVDVGMQGARELIQALTASHPSTKVIALAVEESPDAIIRCAEAGADGYVSRSASIDDFVRAIEAVRTNELHCPPRIAGSLMRHVAALASTTRRPTTVALDRLTPREREIVDLIALRFSNKRIAAHLGIHFSTVKNHVHRILEKLNLTRRQDILAASLAS